jgi:N-acetylneuraminate synthase
MFVQVGDKRIGPNEPVYIVAEIGINHNGDLGLAKRLIDVAVEAGCDAVKFQKRDPDVCVPEEQKKTPRETPWGMMTYLDYKKRIEFGYPEYTEIDRYCRSKGITWFASCWDPGSVDFIERFDVPVHKVASASIGSVPLLKAIAATGKPVILSTGMSAQDEVDEAISLFNRKQLVLCHSVSSYPAPVDQLNLRVIPNFLARYPEMPIGYSGHEVGLTTTYVAVALGACFIERHITLDRAMWGTDQAASVEPQGLRQMVGKIRNVQAALGDGNKKVEASEIPVRRKLRGN